MAYKTNQSYAETDYKKWLDLVDQEQAKTNAAGIAATNNVAGGTHTYDTSGRMGDNSRPVAAGTSGADEFWMSDQDYAQLLQYKQDYANATDQAGKDAAHEAAEALRARYNYSGGTDGSMYLNSAYQNPALYGWDDDDGSYGGGSGYGSGSSGYGSGGYNSQYSSALDALVNGILNREPFSYNKDTDELYQQYKESYTRGGQRAMQDVLAQISARTGGLASSYGTIASQQTYNNYMAELADKVPELYQMRYNMYLDELEQQRADVNMLMGIDNTYYDRYRDTVADQQWQQQFDYNANRDSVADSQWQTQWDYGVQGDSQSAAQNQVDAILQAGGTPSAALLAQAGYSSEYAAALASYYQNKNKGSDNGKPAMSLTTAKQAASNGVFSDEVLAVLRANGYSDEMLKAIYGYNPSAAVAPSNNVVTDGNLQSFMVTVGEMLSAGYANQAISNIEAMWGRLSEGQKKQLNNMLASYDLRFED